MQPVSAYLYLKQNNMTRIISEELNKKFKREYRLRFFSVLFFGLAITLIVNVSLVSSSYSLLTLYEKAYVSNNSNVHASEALKMHEEFNSKLATTYVLANKIPQYTQSITTQVVQILFDYAGNSVELSSLELVSEAPDIKMNIRGVAKTREALLRFQDSIKQDGRFVDFDIPVETLTKQTDVSFNVTFIYHEN